MFWTAAVLGGYLLRLLFKGRDLVSRCLLAFGGKCADFKSPSGFQSQMLGRLIFPVQVPNIWGAWCGISRLCASDTPPACG